VAYEMKDNSGSLWVNNRKTAETHPDRTGSILLNGVEYWLDGWLKKTKDGKPYLSLSVKPKTEAPDRRPEIGDKVPF
jgi:hypothetical protein